MANSEQAEADAVNQVVDTWCETWNVKRDKMKKTYGVNEDGQLTVQVVAPLTTPITSVKTVFIVVNPEPGAGDGSE